VGELPGPDVEMLLVGFVGDPVADPRAEHHLCTAHEVLHYIIKSWHEGFLVNHEKIDFFIGGHLNSDVASNEKNRATNP
jgi:hypothetical protein